MRDPYDVLGVSKAAEASAVKSAFRKLAKKHHPDANKNDPKAAARFSELNAAYEILGDEAKRKAFDNGEIDAEGKPKFQGFDGFGAQPGRGGFGGGQGGFESFSWGPEGLRRGAGGRARAGGGGNFEDVIQEMFGGFGGARGGQGGGAGFDPDNFGAPPGGRDVAAALTVSLADAVHGASKRLRLPTGKEVDVKIPAGLADGQQIRLKGQGLPGHGAPGDVLITVNVTADPRFTREGDNLRLDLPITLDEAVLGAKVRAPTPEGGAVSLAIPPGTSSGRVFRLRGKGMPGKSGRGDLLAAVRIVLPEASDSALEDLMRTWRDQKPYDPRKDLK